MNWKTVKQSRPGFTLIEMLTVVAVIAILVAMLFPAIGAVRKKADRAKAQAEANSIASAIKSYYTEYGKWPVAATSQGGADKVYTNNADIVRVLLANNADDPNLNDVLNPRKIVFLDGRNTMKNGTPGIGPDFNYCDPWGKPYVIAMDLNYDNKVDVSSSPVSGSSPVSVYDPFIPNGLGVAVFSSGADGVFVDVPPNQKKHDDVTSFW